MEYPGDFEPIVNPIWLLQKTLVKRAHNYLNLFHKMVEVAGFATPPPTPAPAPPGVRSLPTLPAGRTQDGGAGEPAAVERRSTSAWLSVGSESRQRQRKREENRLRKRFSRLPRSQGAQWLEQGCALGAPKRNLTGPKCVSGVSP